MVGKTWLYNTRLTKILSFQEKDGEVIIVTDKKWIQIPKPGLADLLNGFLEVDQDDELAATGQALQVASQAHTQLGSLRDVLMDNIQKIQKDKEFIPQAKAINNNVNALINIMRLEYQITKELNGKGGAR